MSSLSDITTKTRIPLYMVCSTLSLAVYGTVLYMNIMSSLNNSFTVQQAQDWLDDARTLNPSINWPRVPAKKVMTSVTNRPPVSVTAAIAR